MRKEIKKDKEYRDLLSKLSDQESLSLTEISYESEKASGSLKDYINSIFDVEGITKIFDVKNITAMSDKIHVISDEAISLVPKMKNLCGR